MAKSLQFDNQQDRWLTILEEKPVETPKWILCILGTGIAASVAFTAMIAIKLFV